MRVVFLGTGNAFNSDGRGSQAIWIEPAPGRPFLVDVGPTALAAMEKLRLRGGDVDTVFFTHMHGDHTAGWPFLLLHDTFVVRRTRALSIIGPVGTASRLERLAEACYPELLEDAKLGFPVDIRELPIQRADGLDAGGDIAFDVVPLEHHETSIGYRFRLGDRRIAVTGDTRWCPGLEELSEGCDLLVVECSSVERQAYAHVSLEELRANAGRLGARRTVLVHLTDEVARSLEGRPIPRVAAAFDGMEVQV